MSHPEPLSPVAVESKLRQLVNQLTQAQGCLSETRNAETVAEIALKRARLAASESESCPKPQRGSVTVAEREAWIDAAVIHEYEVYRQATTAREIAADALRTTRDVASVVQSLAQSVRQAYSMAGQS